MLGFTTLSEAPISEATTALVALAYLPGSPSQGLANALLTDAKAFITTSSATSIITANTFGDVDAQASVSTTGTVSSATVNAFESIHGEANYTPTPVVATFVSGTLEYSAVAHINTTGVAAVAGTKDFEDVDAQARITPTGVTVTSAITSFDEVVGQATVIPSSAATNLTTYIGDFAGVDAQANVFISPVESATNISMLAFDAKANITTPTVTSVTTVSDLLAEAQASATFSGIDLTLFLDLDTPDGGIRFPYQDYADDYSRGRTLFLLGHDSDYTVHVVPENRTVVIEKQQGSNTVHIAA